jgi:carboxyl-terminal processing protease
MSIKNKPLAIYLPLLLAGVLIIGIFAGIELTKYRQNSLMLYPKSDLFNNVLKYIEDEYVDTVSAHKLSEKAIVAMLKDLDPHSVYIPSEELQDVNEPLEGNFSGIGIQFNMQNDTIIVINTIPNGPSARVGLMAGDRIVKVNDSIVAGKKIPSDNIVKKLKGPRGTKVKVTIIRPGQKKELPYEIIRDRIPLYSVDAAYMIDNNTAYIKINQFSRTTLDEFITAVSKLRPQGMNSIILDLRGNGGGYLEAAIGLADQFLDKDKLIVYTEGRAKPRSNSYATASGICQTDKLVVLIDEFSASASEIVAGAIQDNDRGVVVGRRSFGKGLVQEQMPLSDGSALRLTIARYYTPTGRCIQKSYSKGVDDYYHEMYSRFERGELEVKDSIKFNDSLKYTTPKGKIVYGGGGIMPDVFIPLDTTGYTRYFAEVRDLGLIYKYAFDYSDKHRNNLRTHKSYSEMDKYLENEHVFDDFINYAEKMGVKKNPAQLSKSREQLQVQLKAYIVRNFFDNEGFYPVISKIDNTLTQAVELIKK